MLGGGGGDKETERESEREIIHINSLNSVRVWFCTGATKEQENTSERERKIGRERESIKRRGSRC